MKNTKERKKNKTKQADVLQYIVVINCRFLYITQLGTKKSLSLISSPLCLQAGDHNPKPRCSTAMCHYNCGFLALGPASWNPKLVEIHMEKIQALWGEDSGDLSQVNYRCPNLSDLGFHTPSCLTPYSVTSEAKPHCSTSSKYPIRPLPCLLIWMHCPTSITPPPAISQAHSSICHGENRRVWFIREG